MQTMREQEEVYYTDTLLFNKEILLIRDSKKRAKEGWELIKVERYPRSLSLRFLFRTLFIKAIYSREKSQH